MKLRALLGSVVAAVSVWTIVVFGQGNDSIYGHPAGYFSLEIPRGWNVTSEAHAVTSHA